MGNPSISTRELKNFISVARSRSLGEAADKCSLSLPALSIQLKQLESKIGVQLVRRSTSQQSIELTEAGLHFLQAATQALQTLQDAIDRINPLQGQDKPVFRIACLPSLLLTLVSPAIAELSRAFPAARISVLDSDSAVCATLLSAGDCEVAICSRPVNSHEVKSQCLFSESFWVLLRKDDPRANGRGLTLDDFKATTIVNLAENFAVGAMIRARDMSHIKVNTIKAMEGLLVQGLGVAIVAQSTAQSISHELLHKQPLPHQDLSRQIFVSWRPGGHATLTTRFVEGLCRQAATNFPA